MKFQPEEIRSLYGSHFFLIEGEAQQTAKVEESVEEPVEGIKEDLVPKAESDKTSSEFEFLKQGPEVEWRSKKDAELTLILGKEEFSNPDLTRLLKKLVQEADIPFAKVAFGILPEMDNGADFTKMPTPTGIICHHFPGKLPSPIELGGKQYFPAASLYKIQEDGRYMKAMQILLSRVRDLVT